jgi:hypothetical protein
MYVRKCWMMSLIYLILGLTFGVFYREFTVYHDFTGSTQLSVLHGHALALGFGLMLFLLLFERGFEITRNKRFDTWFILYQISLLGVLVSMLTRGIGQVLAFELAGFNHVAGLFHTLLGISLVWIVLMIGRSTRGVESI